MIQNGQMNNQILVIEEHCWEWMNFQCFFWWFLQQYLMSLQPLHLNAGFISFLRNFCPFKRAHGGHPHSLSLILSRLNSRASIAFWWIVVSSIFGHPSTMPFSMWIVAMYSLSKEPHSAHLDYDPWYWYSQKWMSRTFRQKIWYNTPSVQTRVILPHHLHLALVPSFHNRSRPPTDICIFWSSTRDHFWMQTQNALLPNVS